MLLQRQYFNLLFGLYEIILLVLIARIRSRVWVLESDVEQRLLMLT